MSSPIKLDHKIIKCSHSKENTFILGMEGQKYYAYVYKKRPIEQLAKIELDNDVIQIDKNVELYVDCEKKIAYILTPEKKIYSSDNKYLDLSAYINVLMQNGIIVCTKGNNIHMMDMDGIIRDTAFIEHEKILIRDNKFKIIKKNSIGA